MNVFLSDFRPRRPAHESPQDATLGWLASAHARAEATRRGTPGEPGDNERSISMEKVVRRFGCPPSQIGTRGHEVADCLHTRWSEMAVYDLEKNARGAGADVRTAVFAQAVDAFFEEIYADEAVPPREVIHVTCTGYVAPSGAQKVVARKG